MVSKEAVLVQLKRLGFNHFSWGKSEVDELPNIILPDEIIYECVNGVYEAGFCLLVATNFRVLLIDRKPLNYLTVIDLRFDMINDIEYSHRLMGAQITINTGQKTLHFRSYNQQRLRKLIDHVQHRMAEAKHSQTNNDVGQAERLGLINPQLEAYLMAQYQNQQKLNHQLQHAEMADINKAAAESTDESLIDLSSHKVLPEIQYSTNSINPNELLEEGIREVFGKRTQQDPTIY